MNKAKVLVIDDDPEVCLSTARLLQSADLTVETFCSAEEFLSSGRRDTPACLVLDVRRHRRVGRESIVVVEAKPDSDDIVGAQPETAQRCLGVRAGLPEVEALDGGRHVRSELVLLHHAAEVSNAERAGQPQECRVVAWQAEAQPVGRVGKGADMDALRRQLEDDARRQRMARQPEQQGAADDLEACVAQQAVEPVAVGHQPLPRRMQPGAVA